MGGEPLALALAGAACLVAVDPHQRADRHRRPDHHRCRGRHHQQHEHLQPGVVDGMAAREADAEEGRPGHQQQAYHRPPGDPARAFARLGYLLPRRALVGREAEPDAHRIGVQDHARGRREDDRDEWQQRDLAQPEWAHALREARGRRQGARRGVERHAVVGSSVDEPDREPNRTADQRDHEDDQAAVAPRDRGSPGGEHAGTQHRTRARRQSCRHGERSTRKREPERGNLEHPRCTRQPPRAVGKPGRRGHRGIDRGHRRVAAAAHGPGSSESISRFERSSCLRRARQARTSRRTARLGTPVVSGRCSGNT